MKIVMEWTEFVELATSVLKNKDSNISAPKFRKRQSHEPDMDMYDFPDYVEFEVSE